MEKTPLNIFVFSGGRLDPEYLKGITRKDFIIGVDSAALWLIKHGFTPDLAVGDFDSVSSAELKVIETKAIKTVKYPPEKNSTDLELALDWAVPYNPASVTVYGSIGSRLDHSLSSVLLLEKYSGRNIKFEIRNRYNCLILIDNKITVKRDHGFKYVSLLSLDSSAVISLSGFLYPLRRRKIRRWQSLCLSNELVKEKGEVTVHRGKVILIKSRDGSGVQ